LHASRDAHDAPIVFDVLESVLLRAKDAGLGLVTLREAIS
jgi:hypothetical protein